MCCFYNTLQHNATHCNTLHYISKNNPIFNIFTSTVEYVPAHWYAFCAAMGWLRLVGSIKLYVSYAQYSRFYKALLQRRPIILRSLLIAATPYVNKYRAFFLKCVAVCCGVVLCVAVWRSVVEAALCKTQITVLGCKVIIYFSWEVRCSVVQCGIVWCDVVQYVAEVALCELHINVLVYMVTIEFFVPEVCCSVLQCVAVCCSVLQCVAVCCRSSAVQNAYLCAGYILIDV